MATQEINITDISIIITYFLVSILIGCYFLSKGRTTLSFISPPLISKWLLGFSIYGTYISNIAILSLPSEAFFGNWSSIAVYASLPLCAWVASKYFITYYRGKGYISAYSHLRDRFGPRASDFSVLSYLLLNICRNGIIVYLMGNVISAFTGWESQSIIIATVFVVMLYTYIGGMNAIIWVDLIRGIIILASLLASIITIFYLISGEFKTTENWLLNSNKLSLGDFSLNFSTKTIWILIIYGFFSNLLGYIGEQSTVQRYIMAKTTNDAKHALWIGAILTLLTIFALFFIGSCFSYIIHAHLPAAVQVQLTSETDLFIYLYEVIPSGIKGLLIITILAAGMSSIDIELIACSTILYKDVYCVYYNRIPTEQESFRFLHMSSLLIALFGVMLSLILNIDEGAVNKWWTFDSIFSGGILGLIILAFLSKNITKKQGLVSIIVGITVTLLFCLFNSSSIHPIIPIHNLLAVVIGSMSIITVGFSLNFLQKNK